MDSHHLAALTQVVHTRGSHRVGAWQRTGYRCNLRSSPSKMPVTEDSGDSTVEKPGRDGLVQVDGATSTSAEWLATRPSWHDALEGAQLPSLVLLPRKRAPSLDLQVEGHPTEAKGSAVRNLDVGGTLRTIPDWQDISKTWQLVFLVGILGQKGQRNIVGQFTQFGWSLWIALVVWYEGWLPDMGGLCACYRRVSLFWEIYTRICREWQSFRSSACSPEVREKLMEGGGLERDRERMRMRISHRAKDVKHQLRNLIEGGYVSVVHSLYFSVRLKLFQVVLIPYCDF